MYRFLESIAVCGKEAPLLSYHQNRYEACMRHFYPESEIISLSNLLHSAPEDDKLYKLRIEYSDQNITSDFIPYTKRLIEELVLIDGSNLEYQWKYADRTQLEKLRNDIKANQEIIILKEGFLTDSFYSNIVLQKGAKLITPEKPLLYGVQRSNLLEKGIIQTSQIHFSEISKFDHIIFINALMDLKSGIKIPTNRII